MPATQTSPSSIPRTQACAVMLGVSPPNNPDGMPKSAIDGGVSTPATVIRHASDQPRRGPPSAAFEPASLIARKVITPKDTEANSSMLVIGTAAREGWLTSMLASFHPHHFSCGPSWSKIS